MLGGAMRQVGVIAAAGIHAVQHHRHRMVDDHTNAARLAERLNEIDGIEAAYGPAQTNMVFTTFTRATTGLAGRLKADGVTIGINPLYSDGGTQPTGGAARLVTHDTPKARDLFGAHERVHLLSSSCGIKLPIPGQHNIANASLAISVAASLDIPEPDGIKALASFPGVERRLATCFAARENACRISRTIRSRNRRS